MMLKSNDIPFCITNWSVWWSYLYTDVCREAMGKLILPKQKVSNMMAADALVPNRYLAISNQKCWFGCDYMKHIVQHS